MATGPHCVFHLIKTIDVGNRLPQRPPEAIEGSDSRAWIVVHGLGLLGELGNPPGSDGAGGPLQRVRGDIPSVRLGGCLQLAQHLWGLLGEQMQNLAFKWLVAHCIAGKERMIDWTDRGFTDGSRRLKIAFHSVA